MSKEANFNCTWCYSVADDIIFEWHHVQRCTILQCSYNTFIFAVLLPIVAEPVSKWETKTSAVWKCGFFNHKMACFGVFWGKNWGQNGGHGSSAPQFCRCWQLHFKIKLFEDSFTVSLSLMSYSKFYAVHYLISRVGLFYISCERVNCRSIVMSVEMKFVNGTQHGLSLISTLNMCEFLSSFIPSFILYLLKREAYNMQLYNA